MLILVTSCNQTPLSVTAPKVVSKELIIQELGFNLHKGQYISPGETVKVFAKTNKVTGISYNWEISAGNFVEIENGLIEYVIPESAGDYTIKVIAIDRQTDQTVQRSLTVKVGSLSAIAVPDKYSMTISQNNSMNMKISGELKSASLTKIWIDGETSIVQSQSEAGMNISKMIGDRVFTANDEGKFRSVGSSRDLMGSLDSVTLEDHFEVYREIFGEPVRSGTDLVFSKNENDVETVLTVNQMGFPLQNQCRDSISGEFQESYFTYQEIDGFLFPESFTQNVSMPLGDEVVTSTITIKFEDIMLDCELPTDAEIAEAFASQTVLQ